MFSLCQQGLLIDGQLYELIEGDYPVRLIQVFSSVDTDFVFVQNRGGGLQVHKTNSTAVSLCEISSCSQQLPPVCDLLCDDSDTSLEMICLNTDLWVANRDVSLKPVQLNSNILLFSF